MKCYVAGFYFNETGEKVALVHKNRPTWQRGQINAIGGKVELGESPYDAIEREFLEETGVQVSNWEQVIEIYGDDWKVYFFRAFGDPSKCKTIEDEKIKTYLTKDALALPNLISNLYWILPLSLDKNVKTPLKIWYETATL